MYTSCAIRVASLFWVTPGDFFLLNMIDIGLRLRTRRVAAHSAPH
jgi:hypothetical protein